MDWLSFALTVFVAFAVYLATLTPEVTLGYSGIHATAALYSSPSMPSGHPVWAIYGWCFTHLIPFSNVAWRLGAASALAGAFAGGLVALMVSRIGVLVAAAFPNFQALSTHQQSACRLICGAVAGWGLAFDGGFWGKAVVPDTWTLSVCLFALSLCFLSRWFFAPEQKRYLFLAALVHGVTLSESQAFLPATFAAPFVVTLGNKKLGQQMFLLASICLLGILLMRNSLEALGWKIGIEMRFLLIAKTTITMLAWLGLWFLTRTFFCEWKTAVICAACFATGVSLYFLLPVFSMTNPPVNWGYPRTIEGFFHVVTRGQWEAISPTSNFGELLLQWKIYWSTTATDIGIYLVPAVIPFLLLKRTSARARGWLVGLLLLWFLTTVLTLEGLNAEAHSAEQVRPYFAPTHLILVTLAGYGLMAFAVAVTRPSLSKA